MGRRKIEIKAIKDDRNRSVTFLKRKGGLFKKAHELSVLCSVDVAVFIFGNNKKLYEYSSTDMRDLITRYQYHAGPSEHKGPSDFNAGNDDEEDEEGEGTPPHGHDGIDNTMLPPQFHGQPFPQIRHHTPSASPPIGNGSQFQPHPGHPAQRGHTPQPSIGSRPGSRNDMRRLGPGMVSQQPVGPPGAPHAGITFVPTPHIYNPPSHPQQPGMMSQQPPQQYSYPPQQNQMQHPQPYMDDRRASMPPAFSSQPPSQGIQSLVRPSPSPQPNHQQLPQNPIPQMSPPPPQQQHIQRRSLDPLPPPPVEPKTEPIERPMERPQPPLLKTDIAIKKLPQRKTHSIFTPIEENRSILSQHLASFTRELPKTESGVAAAAANAAASAANRSQSVDASSAARSNSISSPPVPQRSNTMSSDKSSNGHMPTIPETTFTPPSRSNSAKVGGAGGARPRGPRLTVQIPNDGSEAGGTPTAESISPRNPTETTTQVPQRNNSLVLPPPSPSASALLSAGATGPPNPFARPPPQQTVNGESVTPVSALPSRFLNSEFLPSPSSFYHDWPFRGPDGNSHLSPLNFATPVVGSGPSFLRDENSGAGNTSNSNLSVVNSNPAANKRKTPEITTGPSEPPEPSVEPKRVKVE